MEFVYPQINLISVLVAAVAQFVLGFLWYSPMTPVGARWMAEMGIDPSNDKPGLEMLAFPVSSIMAAWAVAMTISWSGAGTVSEAVLAAMVAGFAAIAQSIGQTVANSQSAVLGVIHITYLALGYAIMGALVLLLR